MGLLKASVETELNILQLRKNEGLTPDMKEVIEILTIDPANPPKIVGSFRYRIHEYPADIDLYEGVQACCTFDTSVQAVAKSIQAMVRRIKKRRYTYLGDFKAGVDERYRIDIGDFDVEKNRAVGYSQDSIINRVAELYEQELLSKEEAVDIIRNVPRRPDAVRYQELKDAVRRHYILRWTPKELLQGYKMLPQKKKVTLETAISQGTIVKADLWALVDDRFMEITNWFMITAKVDGAIVNLSEKPDMYQQSLQKDIMLFKNPMFKKHMKLAKRMWLYAISNEDRYTIRQLYPLFSSPIAKLYQIQSEIEILINMLERLAPPPVFLIKKQIALFKTRIGSVPDIYVSEEAEAEIFKDLDSAISAAGGAGTAGAGTAGKNIPLMIEKLEKTFAVVRDIVDDEAMKYLRKNIPQNKLFKTLLGIIRRKR